MDTLNELMKLIEILDSDIESISTEECVKDYVVPILKAVVSEVSTNRQLIQNTAHDTALAMITAQKTYAGEVLLAIADNFAVILENVEADPESDLGQALNAIDQVLGAWMALEYDSDDEDSDDEGSDDEDSDDEDSDDVGSDDDGSDDDGSEVPVDTEGADGN